MNYFTRLSLGITAIYLFIVLILPSTGALTFGHGPGDLAYSLIIVSFIIIVSAVYSLTKGIDFQQRKFLAFCLIILLLFFISYSTYLFTIGRGKHYLWDGKVFI